LICTGIVFLTGQVIFVPEWLKGEFVSFCVGCILLTKSLLCNVAVFIREAAFLQEDSVKLGSKFISVPC
jgi:hypothetical protein